MMQAFPGFDFNPKQVKMSSGDSAGFTVVKYVFFAFNVFVWLLGCGLLVLGIWLHVSKGPYASLLPSYTFLSATALCIAAGVVILVVGFLGCCGALMENQCMLVLYFSFVLLIFALEIAAGALGFVYREEIKTAFRSEMKLSIVQKYNPESEEELEEGLIYTWNMIQEDLECCGVFNYTDWYNIDAWPDSKHVPPSCCRIKSDECGKLGEDYWYSRGCMEEIEYWFVRNMYIIGIVGITVGVLQIMAMVASIMLFCCLRNQKFLL